MSSIRRRRTQLPAEKLNMLEALGFIWSQSEHKFNLGVIALAEFKKKEGHCSPPPSAMVGGFNLGSWTRQIRKRRSTLRASWRATLDQMGFKWDPYSDKWQEGLSYLQYFYREFGHTRVPHGLQYRGYGLGFWVARQRHVRSTLTAAQIAELEKLQFVWAAEEKEVARLPRDA